MIKRRERLREYLLGLPFVFDITYSVVSEPRKAIKIIADNMIKTRPLGEVVYRPYHKSDIYCDLPIVGPKRIDIKKLHPDIKPGNVVFVSAILDSCDSLDAKINFIGDARVIIDGKTVFDSAGDAGRHSLEIFLRRGETPITFAITCSGDECIFEFMPSVRAYWMWAKYYLLNVRVKSPLTAYSDEDGVAISRVYTAYEDFDGAYVYPVAPVQSSVMISA